MKLLAALISLALATLAPPEFAYNCEGLVCQFLETTPAELWDLGEPEQLWDFGDGWLSTDPQPFHVYEAPGIYAVTLTTPAGSVAHPVSVLEQCTRRRGKCRN